MLCRSRKKKNCLSPARNIIFQALTGEFLPICVPIPMPRCVSHAPKFMHLLGGFFKWVIFKRFIGSVLGKLIRETRATAKEFI